MSRMKSKGYPKSGQRADKTRQTGRTGHTLMSCPPVRLSDEARDVVSALDMVAHEMEMKWGVDRLSKLVNAELGSRFNQQLERLNRALAANDSPAIVKHGNGMKKAWQVLDAEAEKIGASHVGQEFWEMRHPTKPDITVRLVRTAAEMPTKNKDEDVAYLCAEELIAFVPGTVLEIKKVFAGAKVTDMKPSETMPDDPIPF